MSTVYITEFASMNQSAIAGSGFLLPQYPPIAKQAVAIGQQSAPFNQATRIIRIESDATCSFAIGSNVTATTTDARLAAGTPEFAGVQPGHLLSSVTNT